MLRNLLSLSVLLVLIPAVENAGLFGNFLGGLNTGILGLGGGSSANLNLGGILSGNYYGGILSGNSAGGLSEAIKNAIGSRGCSSYPCQHTCTDTFNGYTCACNPGFRVSSSNSNDCEAISICIVKPDGSLAVKPPAVVVSPPVSVPSTGAGDVVKNCSGGVKVDIVLVIDASGSIGKDNYNHNFDFLLKLLAGFTIGPADVNVAAFIFSSTYRTLFTFKDNLNLAGIKKKFDNADYLDDKTYTWKVLDYINDSGVFDQKNGGRSDALKFALVVTDGKSQDTFATTTAAAVLRNKYKATMLVVPVGSDVDLDEVKGIASTEDDIIRATSYANLATIAGKVALRFCNLKLGLGAAVAIKG
jgi:hypothetical protein